MDRLAEVCEQIAGQADPARKSALLNDYLNTLTAAERAIAEPMFAVCRKPLVGGVALREAIIAVTGWDREVLRACREATGDTAEMAALLLAGHTRNKPLPLESASELYREFAKAAKSATKTAILTEILPAHRPLTLKYFLRGLLGNLRLGLAPAASDTQAVAPSAGHRLHAVITSAEQGRGKLATSLSEYTLAVRSGDQFVNVGKARGPSEREIRQLTRVLRKSTVERFGRVALVRPEVVLEIAFERVEKSRHKGGYALVTPRVIGWRRDKKPEDCDHLDRLKQLYELTNQRAAEAPSLLF